jgi:hypothetical protein
MTILEWVGIITLLFACTSAQYFIIMNSVDGKIDRAMNKLKDEQLQKLMRENERLVSKNEMLRDGLKEFK